MIGDGSGDFRVSKAMRFWAHNPREGKRLLKRDVALREQEGEEVAPELGGLEPSWPEPLTKGPLDTWATSLWPYDSSGLFLRPYITIPSTPRAIPNVRPLNA